MPIGSDAELEKALEEFHRLSDAGDGTPGAKRRDELNAEIQQYYVTNSNRLRAAKPESDPTEPAA